MPTQPTFTCATCDAQIAHHPVFHLGLAFCCAGCAADGPCMCSYDAVGAPELVARTVAAATTAQPEGSAGPRPAGAPVPVPAAAAVTSPSRGEPARRRSAARGPNEAPTLVDVGS
jgi:hypothetical protein